MSPGALIKTGPDKEEEEEEEEEDDADWSSLQQDQDQNRDAGPGQKTDAEPRVRLTRDRLSVRRCPVLRLQPVCPHCSAASTRVKAPSACAITTSGHGFQNKTPCDSRTQKSGSLYTYLYIGVYTELNAGLAKFPLASSSFSAKSSGSRSASNIRCSRASTGRLQVALIHRVLHEERLEDERHEDTGGKTGSAASSATD
ncbi:hypothetical protein EYF80_041748 [Liparis tanakae]|uniref:Uncharacterized protein n=1 Tax=Liparis tanakae TaxID=230148 RepID=A0A4Z2G579_9TELE|nr:hypothetical protein EYF80_041748 [Liparis tanakae]